MGLDHRIATPNELPYPAERPKHPNNKAFDKSGVHSKSPQVADTVIEADPETQQKSYSNGYLGGQPWKQGRVVTPLEATGCIPAPIVSRARNLRVYIRPAFR